MAAQRIGAARAQRNNLRHNFTQSYFMLNTHNSTMLRAFAGKLFHFKIALAPIYNKSCKINGCFVLNIKHSPSTILWNIAALLGDQFSLPVLLFLMT